MSDAERDARMAHRRALVRDVNDAAYALAEARRLLKEWDLANLGKIKVTTTAEPPAGDYR